MNGHPKLPKLHNTISASSTRFLITCMNTCSKFCHQRLPWTPPNDFQERNIAQPDVPARALMHYTVAALMPGLKSFQVKTGGIWGVGGEVQNDFKGFSSSLPIVTVCSSLLFIATCAPSQPMMQNPISKKSTHCSFSRAAPGRGRTQNTVVLQNPSVKGTSMSPSEVMTY